MFWLKSLRLPLNQFSSKGREQSSEVQIISSPAWTVMVVFERAHSLWSSRFCSVAAGQHFPSTHGLLRIGRWVSALSRRGIRNADASSGWRRSVSQTSQTHSTCVVERIVLGVFGNTTSDTCTTALLWLSVTHTEFKNDVKQTVPVWKGLTDLYFIVLVPRF